MIYTSCVIFQYMYIRSTDINRTVTSAMANFIGMYYNRSNGENDFPNEAGWPYGFIPAPIHTVDDATDYVCLYAHFRKLKLSSMAYKRSDDFNVCLNKCSLNKCRLEV
ncbi:unnamed protein product [Toxocara canis]|uniref:Uncharacterized protein n=1 Tax=Toxocara canis TaxID=6265 RepID=A0A3P7FBJ4_TOXCA|nr:unnamed protein product [Toxocara canis]